MNPDSDLPTVSTKGADRVLVDVVRRSPVDIAQAAKRRRLLLWLIIVVLLIVGYSVLRRFTADKPVAYASSAQHFLYGSIGSEPGGSLVHPIGGMLPPYQVFAVLPDMFPDKLPGGYASLGLIFEKDENGKLRDLPIGVSRRRRLGVDMVGLNCAVCHVGTLRTRPDGPTQIIPGMPAHQLDLQAFFAFVLDSTLDPRFTADNVIGHVQAKFGRLSLTDRVILRAAIGPLRERTLLLKSRVGLLFAADAAQWGPGRVDTFNPYKSLQFGWQLERLPKSEIVAASDFPSLWNQGPREGMNLHWDGNNTSLDERNLSAGLGAGITPTTVDHDGVARVKAYITNLPPPRWPEGPDMPLDHARAQRGAATYRKYCADCHDFGAPYVGHVEPIEKIGTDRARFDSYTTTFADNQNTLFAGTPYRFHSFRKTVGYTSPPLDGIWARAPYLHNGSVPTLADLLEPPADRPKAFYRGYDVYDPKRVGFVSDVAEDKGHKYFLYRTVDEQGRPIAGNSKEGHLYGTDLPAAEKQDLLEYLKTL